MKHDPTLDTRPIGCTAFPNRWMTRCVFRSPFWRGRHAAPTALKAAMWLGYCCPSGARKTSYLRPADVHRRSLIQPASTPVSSICLERGKRRLSTGNIGGALDSAHAHRTSCESAFSSSTRLVHESASRRCDSLERRHTRRLTPPGFRRAIVLANRQCVGDAPDGSDPQTNTREQGV